MGGSPTSTASTQGSSEQETIVVTGRRYDDSGGASDWKWGWEGGGGYDYGHDYDSGDYGGGGGGSDGSGSYPADFDHTLDDVADAMAAQMGAEIAAKPDVATVEYVAIIWIDANGNLHTTTIEEGLNTSAPLDTAWAQVDWANGGKIYAIIHSHPQYVDVGSSANPNWVPAVGNGTLSSSDFDQLMSYGSGSSPHFDSVNYRSYLVANGVVSEYYAFQQDPSQVGPPGPATWAVSSSDYGW